MGRTSKTWLARILVASVFAMNVACAIQFIILPASFTSAYSLEGPGAVAAVQGFGVCFLMWNATYPPVIAQPDRHRVLFWVVLAQQLIGLIGELAISCGVDPAASIHASIMRFALFDAVGLALLVVACVLARSAQRMA